MFRTIADAVHGNYAQMYLVGAPTHPSAAGFNSKIHNWYHPMAKAHNDSLALSQGPRSWSPAREVSR